jgi:zinc protease
MAIIDSVKKLGVSDSDVQKVREQQQRTQEVQVKQNGYWASNISARIENEEDPRGLLAYGDFIKNLTGEQIKQAAIRFLDTGRYARFVLLPERVVP